MILYPYNPNLITVEEIPTFEIVNQPASNPYTPAVVDKIIDDIMRDDFLDIIDHFLDEFFPPK